MLLLFSKLNLAILRHFYNKVNGQGIPCERNSSYSFLPILSKLHWFFGHGLKISMWLRYNPQIIFVTFLQVGLSHISSIKWTGDTLKAQLSLQFYTDSFETSLGFWSWSEDMQLVWISSSDYFCLFFLQVELSHFSGNIYNKVNGRGIPCWHNSYSFISILSKLHWCYVHGLKICMWFGYNP